MESVSLVTRQSAGLPVTSSCFAVGALRRPTKATVNLPDAERKYYNQLQLRPNADQGDVLYAFCEDDQAEAVAAALSKAKTPVPVVIEMDVERGGTYRVTRVKFEG